jgi:hypothetical protein
VNNNKITTREGITLAKSQATSIFNPVVWEQIKGIAETFVQSKALPAYLQNAAQVVVVMSHGLDMGMSPSESLSSLYPVNGSVTIWGRAVIARLTKMGYKIKYDDGECMNEKAFCTATVTAPDGQEFVEKYTFEEAQASIHMNDKNNSWKAGWKPGQNRKLKMRYGAINIILKSYLPHLLYGCNGLADIDGEAIQDLDLTPSTTVEPKVDPQAFLKAQEGVIEGEAVTVDKDKVEVEKEKEVSNE